MSMMPFGKMIRSIIDKAFKGQDIEKCPSCLGKGTQPHHLIICGMPVIKPETCRRCKGTGMSKP